MKQEELNQFKEWLGKMGGARLLSESDNELFRFKLDNEGVIYKPGISLSNYTQMIINLFRSGKEYTIDMTNTNS